MTRQSREEVSSAMTQQQGAASRPDITGVHVPTSRGYEFYRLWLGFLLPLHRMCDFEIKVLAHILLRREEIAASVSDPVTVDEILFSTPERKRLCERIGCSMPYLRQSLVRLRKSGAMSGNTVEPRLIPRFRKNDGEYILMIHFCFNGDNED